jgi:acyl homoserine lactone synthase
MGNTFQIYVAHASMRDNQTRGIPELTSEIGPIRIPATELFRFRFGIFKQKLEWEVPTVDNQFEIDEFDGPATTYLMSMRNQVVTGCMRLIPTTMPYMLKDTFPQLLNGASAPVDPTIWEVSRFACEEQGGDNHICGISESSLALMQTAIRIAVEKKLSAYAIVTTAGFERLLHRLGVETQRYGPIRTIGRERTVAFLLPINARNVKAFLVPDIANGHYPEYSVQEATLEPFAHNH